MLRKLAFLSYVFATGLWEMTAYGRGSGVQDFLGNVNVFGNLTYSGTLATVFPSASGDDTATINNLLNGNKLAVQLAPGQVYTIKTPINIGDGSSSAKSTVQSISLLGGSRGTAPDQMALNGQVIIRADPTFSGSAMVNINGPIGGVWLRGLVLDCNGVVATGLNSQHMMDSRIEDVLVTRWTGTAYIQSAYSQTITGVAEGGNDNLWINADARGPDNSGTGRNGIQIGATTDSGAPHFDVARNTYINCRWERTANAADSSIILQFCDALWFYGCEAVALGGGLTGNALTVNATVNATTFPKNIVFTGFAGLGSYNLPAISGWPLPGEIRMFNNHAGDSAPIPAHDKVSGNTTFGQEFGRFHKSKPNDQTVNNSGAVNDNDLFFSAAANEILFVEIFLVVNGASVNSDFVVNWNTFPVGATASWGVLADNATAGGFTSVGAATTPPTNKTQAQAITRGSGAGVDFGVSIACIIQMGANAGTIQLQWGQATPTAENTIVRKGSLMRVKKLA